MSRPTKRERRPKRDIGEIKAAIMESLCIDQPMTVRQLFYRLVSQSAIEKSETEYKSTVVRLLGEMRRDGEIPFSWIADSTRWMRKPRTNSSLEDAVQRTAATY